MIRHRFVIDARLALPVILGLCLFQVASGGRETRADEKQEWVALFDGKTINGWEVNGGFAAYEAKDGMVIGRTVEGSPNTFLCKGPYGDFELEYDVQCDVELNAGVQIRSHVYGDDSPKKGRVYGYQCEIATKASGDSGNFYDEGRRGKFLDDFSNKPEAKTAFKDGEWNHYRIVAQGNHIRSWLNDVACADFHDDLDASGFVGLQVHGIGKGQGPYRVRWKNIRMRELKDGEIVE